MACNNMPRKSPGPPCAICGKPSVAQKLCAMHYKRFQRHGHIKQTRPDDWGARNPHPLNQTWRWTGRMGRVPRWNDFWAFVEDVGDRPAPDHALRRQDNRRLFGPDNWYWAEPVLVNDKATRDGRNAYAKAWRKKNPLLAKNAWLKRYGITITDYEALLHKQNGKCAICGQKSKDHTLAVDHCHRTRRVRGLLCSQCNQGLGRFKDKPELLRRAIAYLGRKRS